MRAVSRLFTSSVVLSLGPRGVLGVLAVGVGCQSAMTLVAPATPDEPVPLGRLPAGVRPTHESLALDIDPAQGRFGGTADIALHLDRPRARLWLHGRGLAVRS